MAVETTDPPGPGHVPRPHLGAGRGRRPVEVRLRLGQPAPRQAAVVVPCAAWSGAEPLTAPVDRWRPAPPGCPLGAVSTPAGQPPDAQPGADRPTAVGPGVPTSGGGESEDPSALLLALGAPTGAQSAERYIWQVQVLTRAHLLRARWQGVAARAGRAQTEVVERLLAEAEAACAVPRGWWRHRHGGPVEAAWTSLHTAEVLLVAAGGPRPGSTPGTSPDEDPSAAAVRLQERCQESARRHVALRSFRGTVLAAAVASTVVAVGLVLVGLLEPRALPMCATSDGPCLLGAGPGPWDVAVVAVVGAAAGALSGVLSLRDLEGSGTPFAVPVALAALKVPVGALGAVLGLLLLAALQPATALGGTSAAGLLAWAVVLGASQQLLTRLADAQGRALLSKV